MMCLYCGGGKQTDSTQPYIPEQGSIWATTNKTEGYTTTTLNGISNLSNCVIEGSGVDTSISLSCSGYRNEECLATKEPFITSCKGKKEKCVNEYGPC
jgi:hypothetical protein